MSATKISISILSSNLLKKMGSNVSAADSLGFSSNECVYVVKEGSL